MIVGLLKAAQGMQPLRFVTEQSVCEMCLNIVCSLQLKDTVLITGVTIEHIPKELSPNGSLDSAPKDIMLVVSVSKLTWLSYYIATTHTYIQGWDDVCMHGRRLYYYKQEHMSCQRQ